MSLGSGQWPQQGHLQFCGVRLKYGREAPYALAGVTFELRPGQKVGICGRTGLLPAPQQAVTLTAVRFCVPFDAHTHSMAKAVFRVSHVDNQQLLPWYYC